MLDDDADTANIKARAYVYGGAAIFTITTTLLAIKLYRHTTLRDPRAPDLFLTFLFVLPQMALLIGAVGMVILLHTGLKINGFEIVPQLLRNVCEVAKASETAGLRAWPCARDELVGMWDASHVDFQLLSKNQWVTMYLYGALMALGQLSPAWYFGRVAERRRLKEESKKASEKMTEGQV